MAPREFYKLALDIMKRAEKAASHTAMSRAYYGALHHAARAVETMSVDLPSDHRPRNIVADKPVDVGLGLKHEVKRLRNGRGKAED